MPSMLGIAESSGSASSIGFNGELHERHLEWQVLGNGYRAFNPGLLRFHSPDNLSPFDEGGLNAYAYCGDDPINCQDPSGHFLQYFALGLGASAIVAGAGSVIAKAADDGGASDILWKVALGLGIAGAVMLGGFAMQRGLRGPSSRKPSGSPPPAEPGLENARAVNVDNASFYPGKHRDVLVAHGNRGVTDAQGPVSGTTLGRQIKQQVGPDYQFKPTKFLTCRSDFGGKFASQAQALSNELRVTITGFKGRTHMPNGIPLLKPGYEFVFHPQSRNRSIRTAYWNEVLHKRYPLLRTR